MDEALRDQVRDRDGNRCRWCGRTNVAIDLHHIVYRRAAVDDAVDNLICLCREHHDLVHGRSSHFPIGKREAQVILFKLRDTPGITALALIRQTKAAQ